MPIYVDCERNSFQGMVMCHMVADTPDELHAMASAIGMRREWYQSPMKASFPHYDVPLPRRVLAIKNGAKEITARELVVFMRATRKLLFDNGKTWRESGWW